jgi:SAM-dependent methyltransferase
MDRDQYELHAQIEEKHWWFRARRRIIRGLVETLLPVEAGRSLWDIGCGTGGNTAALSQGYRAIGIDPSQDAIELARLRFPNLEFVCGHGPEALEPMDAAADAILLLDVLEHVADDQGLLLRWLPAVRPGGYVILTVPADPRLWSEHDESFGHFRRYELEGFPKVWEGLPVEPCLVTAYNARLYPLVKAARRVSQWRGHAAGAVGTDFRIPMLPMNRGLEEIFAGELATLTRSLGNNQSSQVPYRQGVSLLAVLRATGTAVRTAGEVPAVSLDGAWGLLASPEMAPSAF